MCGGRAEPPSLIPSSYLLPFFIPRASLSGLSPRASGSPVILFTHCHPLHLLFLLLHFHANLYYICMWIDALPPKVSNSELLLYSYKFPLQKDVGHSLGISWTSALCAPTRGGCHWPRMGGGRDFVRLEGQDSGGLCTSWWQHFTTRAVFQAETEKQMFASAPRRKSSREVVASQAVCNLGSLIALQKWLSDYITVTVGMEWELKSGF